MRSAFFHREDVKTVKKSMFQNFFLILLGFSWFKPYLKATHHFFLHLSSRLRGEHFFLFLVMAGFAGGCAPTGRYALEREEGPQSAPPEAIHNAEEYLKSRPDWKIDCSHFVLACYHPPQLAAFFRERGWKHHNLVYDLNTYLTLHKTRRPRAADIQPGDILIFNQTYDINRDGHIDGKDVFTHVGIVESVQDMEVTYIDASASRRPPRLHRRRFSFYGDKYNERVAVDPSTGRKIYARDT